MSPPWPGLLVGDRIVVPACHYVSRPAREARVVATSFCRAEFLLGSRSIGDPGFMNPTDRVPTTILSPYRAVPDLRSGTKVLGMQNPTVTRVMCGVRVWLNKVCVLYYHVYAFFPVV